MTVVKKGIPAGQYLGTSGDDKPTDAANGSTFYETDTGVMWITGDGGTTWVEKETIVRPETSRVTTMTATELTTAADTNEVALAANTSRLYALFVNDSDAVIYLRLGETAVLHEGIRLNASGGSYEIVLTNLYRGIVNARCTDSGKVLMITEGV